MLDGRRQDVVIISLILDTAPGGANIDVSTWVEWTDWTAFINNGYTIRAKLIEHEHGSSGDLENDRSKIFGFIQKQLLPKARSTYIEAKYRLGWSEIKRTQQHFTDERRAIITRMDCPSIGSGLNIVEIEAIDNASWFLNRGNTSGRVYTGRVGGQNGVISQCINEYTSDSKPRINPTVGDTVDSAQNKWYMMRLDPKTFIVSLMEWSASVTEQGTPWIVQSQDEFIEIKEMASLEAPLDHGLFDIDGERIRPPRKFINREVVINTGGDAQNELIPGGMTLINNPILSIYQSKLYTSGISTVTGKYVDKNQTSSKPWVEVWDNNTQNKLNAEIKADRGFTKPGTPIDEYISMASQYTSLDLESLKSGLEWSTYIKPIPEHNNGDMGLKYWEYISGRSRDYFMKLLYTVMRARVRIVGDPNFDNVKILGPGSVYLSVISADGTPTFLNGEWMVYGFKHIATPRNWETQLFISRLDWNAVAKKLRR